MEFAESYTRFDNPKLMGPSSKVGILGGTFNPIHNGHIEMALNIKDEFSLSKVTLLPTGNPPHKQHERDILASASQRLYMAQAAAAGIDGLDVSDIETARSGFSYTVDTMRELTRTHKDVDFYFIIGSDSLFELETWQSFDALTELVRFICVKRKEDSTLSILAEAARLYETYSTTVDISKYNGLYVSSSYVRSRIAEGKDVSQFLSPAVEEYIAANKLYRKT